MLTNQEIFDKAYAHALTMKHLSKSEDLCRYRDPEHKEKCLIGIFIPDDKYTLDMEGKYVGQLRMMYPDLLIGIGFFKDKNHDEDRMWFLHNLQECHDAAPTLKGMFTKLEEFRVKYNLLRAPK